MRSSVVHSGQRGVPEPTLESHLGTQFAGVDEEINLDQLKLLKKIFEVLEGLMEFTHVRVLPAAGLKLFCHQERCD